MSDAIENYRPVALVAAMNRQAWRVRAIGLSIVFVWVLAILVAPIARASSLAFSNSIYSFFSFICHQQSDRSFHVLGEQFAVCSRCFGVYFGLLAGFVIYPLWRSIDVVEPLPRAWLFLSIIPVTIDWSLTFFGVWENTHVSRCVTGLILGVACATFIMPALVEITRNLSSRKGTFIDSPS